MYVIVWEYEVREEHLADFEKIYGENGAWAELFKKSSGYLGTELLYDSSHPRHYITIDRWTFIRDYQAFLSGWKKEYEKLDAQCEDLTEKEIFLGEWVSLSDETR